jgi:hypothetical protein
MPSSELPESAPKEADIHPEVTSETADKDAGQPAKPNEIGGPKGLEPTRYGDWEQKGRCIDF